MERNILMKINNELNTINVKDSILISKRGFYLYYNEPNKNRKEIKIHSHICGNCAWGSGKISNKEVGRNGVWVGPFQTCKQAQDFANNHFAGCDIEIDSCVKYHPK